jgi:hypothetical protein
MAAMMLRTILVNAVSAAVQHLFRTRNETFRRQAVALAVTRVERNSLRRSRNSRSLYDTP